MGLIHTISGEWSVFSTRHKVYITKEAGFGKLDLERVDRRIEQNFNGRQIFTTYKFNNKTKIWMKGDYTNLTGSIVRWSVPLILTETQKASINGKNEFGSIEGNFEVDYSYYESKNINPSYNYTIINDKEKKIRNLVL